MSRLFLCILLASVYAAGLPSAAQAGDEVAEASASELFATGYQLFIAGDFKAAAGMFQRVLRVEPGHLSARNYLKESLHLLARGAADGSMSQGASDQDNLSQEFAPEPVPAGEGPEAGRDPATYTKVSQVRKKSSHNPRSDDKGSLALGIVGPTLGLGVAVQARPHWAVSIGGGAGGLVVLQGGEESGVFAVYGEAQVLPVPWRLTPVFGVGVSVLVGSFVSQIDARGVNGAGQGLGRVLPYLVMGVRYDAPFGLWASGGIGIVPSIVISDGEAVPAAVPIPGFRLGVNL